jgi:flagellar biosynthetic protein FliR
MNELLRQFGATNAAGFILVLARVSPLFLVAPLFSSSFLPARVRTVVAVGLTIGLMPIAMSGQQLPGDTLAIGGLIAKELLVGLAFALSIGLLFAAVESAGTLLDGIVGFSFGSLINPLTGTQGTILSQLYSMIALAVFVAINGDAWMIQGLARTFDLVPLTAAPKLAALESGVVSTFTTIFASALEVAGPVMLAAIITDVAFGVVSKVVPQLNVFAVGFPVKIVVGLLLVAASMPFVCGWISDQLTSSVAQALQTIRIA